VPFLQLRKGFQMKKIYFNAFLAVLFCTLLLSGCAKSQSFSDISKVNPSTVTKIVISHDYGVRIESADKKR